MAAQPAPRPSFSYQPFYDECASYPELPKFRRFGAQWAKKLYDDVEQISEMEKDLNTAIAEFRRREGRPVLTTLDCPRSIVKPDKELYDQWMEYDLKLRTYSEDLYLSHQLFQLPHHASYFSERLKKYTNLFTNGDFGPTNEKGAASVYQNPMASDFVAWVDIEKSDVLTDICINNAGWIERTFLRRLRSLFSCCRPPQARTQQTTIKLATIVKAIDAITCAFVPTLLTGTMFGLALIQPLKTRIAVVGVFGLIFSTSARLVSGRISRGEMFAYTAAFFAVASVFVSTTNDSCTQTSLPG